MYFVTRLQDCINARSRLGGRDDKVIGSVWIPSGYALEDDYAKAGTTRRYIVWIPSGYALEDDQRQTYATGALEITA